MVEDGGSSHAGPLLQGLVKPRDCETSHPIELVSERREFAEMTHAVDHLDPDLLITRVAERLLHPEGVLDRCDHIKSAVNEQYRLADAISAGWRKAPALLRACPPSTLRFAHGERVQTPRRSAPRNVCGCRKRHDRANA